MSLLWYVAVIRGLLVGEFGHKRVSFFFCCVVESVSISSSDNEEAGAKGVKLDEGEASEYKVYNTYTTCANYFE